MIVPLERLTFLKESSSGMYRTSSYFMGRMLLEIPYVVIAPFLMAVLVYFETGLNTAVILE
jgi:hypothetical protein